MTDFLRLVYKLSFEAVGTLEVHIPIATRQGQCLICEHPLQIIATLSAKSCSRSALSRQCLKWIFEVEIPPPPPSH